MVANGCGCLFDGGGLGADFAQPVIVFVIFPVWLAQKLIDVVDDEQGLLFNLSGLLFTVLRVFLAQFSQ